LSRVVVNEPPCCIVARTALVCNERPQIPADPAFRGRVHFVPFNADFRGREDRLREPTLEAELPGILYKLLEIVPDVIRQGLKPPAYVLRETEDLFAELDLTQQFCDDCLEPEPDDSKFITPDDMRKAIDDWRGVRMTTERDQRQCDQILAELRPRNGVAYKQVRIEPGRGGKRQRCYFGVRFVTMSQP